MTDTRKEFEQFVLDNMRTDAPNFINERRFAEKSWQACQQLNDKRIADLLALIRRKNEALAKISLWKEFPETGKVWPESGNRPMSYSACYGSNGERDYMRGVAIEALALTADDVELVEVGKVNEVGGSLWASQYSPNNGVKVGDIVYTIKQKG